MEKYKNKVIFFEGRGDQLGRDELIKYLSSNGGTITKQIDEAHIIIDTQLPYLEDKIYHRSLDGIEVIHIDTLEKELSDNIDIDSILMAIKISKDQQRLIKLINNKYFSDEVFLVLLKFYDWMGEGIHDTDENRDVSTAMAQRFCKMQEMNHNIKHSPTAIYYTALETDNPKVLESLYNMPEYKINDKNALENQPLSTYEVVALNPNISKPLMMQIFKNKRINELRFLALNSSLGVMIQKELLKIDNDQIYKNLILGNNIPKDSISDILNGKYKNIYLESVILDEALFGIIIEKENDMASFIALSKNETLNSDQIDTLLEYNNDDIIINLLKLPALKSSKVQYYMDKNDKLFNISLAHNTALEEIYFDHLASFDDLDLNISLSVNTSCPKKILDKLYEKNNPFINQGLSSNIQTPINILMQLQLDNRYATLVAKNETYKEFSRNSLGIGNNYSSQFKRDTYEYL